MAKKTSSPVTRVVEQMPRTVRTQGRAEEIAARLAKRMGAGWKSEVLMRSIFASAVGASYLPAVRYQNTLLVYPVVGAGYRAHIRCLPVAGVSLDIPIPDDKRSHSNPKKAVAMALHYYRQTFNNVVEEQRIQLNQAEAGVPELWRTIPA